MVDKAEMNDAQELTLRRLCQRYGCDFSRAHYLVYPPTSNMMAGWAEGWVGGYDGVTKKPHTIYVGVSPEGESHS